MSFTLILPPMPIAALQALSADTVVMLQPARAFGWVGTLADVATIVIALSLIVAAPALALAAWNSRKLITVASNVLERLEQAAQPVLRHATDVADNVNYISAAVRADVEELRGALHAAEARLTDAAEAAEKRMNDFNALIGVVQQEAESLFIDTASTIRGVRAGADALQSGKAAPAWTDESETSD